MHGNSTSTIEGRMWVLFRLQGLPDESSGLIGAARLKVAWQL